MSKWQEIARQNIHNRPAGQGRLAGKITIVTGAAQGFGKGIAEELYAEGAAIIMQARHEADPGASFNIIAMSSKSGLEGSNKNFAYAGSKFGTRLEGRRTNNPDQAGVSYMPTRNTPRQLARLRKLCDDYSMFQISGEDINSPRQSFIIRAMEDPQFQNLIDATWKLIEHENK